MKKSVDQQIRNIRQSMIECQIPVALTFVRPGLWRYDVGDRPSNAWLPSRIALYTILAFAGEWLRSQGIDQSGKDEYTDPDTGLTWNTLDALRYQSHHSSTRTSQ